MIKRLPTDEDADLHVDGVHFRVTATRIPVQAKTYGGKAKPRPPQQKFGLDIAVREIIDGVPHAFLVGRMNPSGECYDTQAWTEKGERIKKRLEKALTAHAIRNGWVVALLCLLMACAAIEPGPVKFGWSGDLAKPHGAECIGKTQCDYYWCPTPCPDAGSTQNADGGTKE